MSVLTHIRKLADRFKFDYSYYWSDSVFKKQRMLHIKVFTDSPTQIDLWLNEADQQALLYILTKGDNGTFDHQ